MMNNIDKNLARFRLLRIITQNILTTASKAYKNNTEIKFNALEHAKYGIKLEKAMILYFLQCVIIATGSKVIHSERIIHLGGF